MPTNEQLLPWGICPNCEYHIIRVEQGTMFDGQGVVVYTCNRCGYDSRESGDFLRLDDLQQMFSEWKIQEFETFKAGIILCAEARRRGVSSSLAEHRGYTTQTINRLAQLENLPEYLLEHTLPLGIYWQALLISSDGDDVDLDKFAELIEGAICSQWSLKQFKEAHGIVVPDRRQPVFEGTAELVEAGEYKFTDREVKVY